MVQQWCHGGSRSPEYYLYAASQLSKCGGNGADATVCVVCASVAGKSIYSADNNGIFHRYHECLFQVTASRHPFLKDCDNDTMATGTFFPNARTCLKKANHSYRLYNELYYCLRRQWWMLTIIWYKCKKDKVRFMDPKKIGYMGRACWCGKISSLCERSEPKYCYWQAFAIGVDKQLQGGGWRSLGHYVKTAKIAPRRDYCCHQKEPMYCQLGKPIGKSLLLFWFLWLCR